MDRYGVESIPTLLPAKADGGLDFVPSFKESREALEWMGFEARSAILELLDEAIADKKAQVGAVLYDLNEPGIVSRLEKLRKRLKVIIDDDGAHGKPKSAETAAAKRLVKTAGMRQHMGKLPARSSPHSSSCGSDFRYSTTSFFSCAVRPRLKCVL